MCRRLSFLALILGLTAFAAYAGSDDYARLARISFLDGQVSFMHPNEVDWSAASINMPLQVGDRIYTGVDGRAEVEFDDGSVIRLAEKTDIEILSLREDVIQLRLLLGLTTATVRSDVGFEMDTPAAAFNASGKGVYRFDVAENGESDAIVRKGSLEAANDKFTRRIESDQFIHVTPGENSAPTVARYETRDEWDEWNDRRNADMMARGSQAYVPDVNMGVSELDRYGRWVTVADYGPAWVPSYVDPYWSPYWAGRWCYRPIWGWTWVSYEPWGWLPYHYGRWYHTAAFGWCWLPGPSFGFHFWSPGLVRFYSGPSWVSWVPLGPGDYYNVNQYHYNSIYAYQLNQLRMLQRRSPAEVINRGVPGGFRTVQTDQFVSGSFGPHSRAAAVTDVDQPWTRGRLVTDRLDIRPVAQSYAPAPERTAVRPQHGNERAPVVVRTQPVFNPKDSGTQVLRAAPAATVIPMRGAPNATERMPAVRNPGVPDTNAGRAMPGRPTQPPAEIRNNTISPSRQTPERSVDPGKTRARETPATRPSPPERTVDRPVRPPERTVERPAKAPERPQTKPPEARPRPKNPPEELGDSAMGVSLDGRRASYYSREQGWVQVTPSYSRGTNAVQWQPNYTRSDYQASQPTRETGATRSYPQAAAEPQRSLNVSSSFQGRQNVPSVQTRQYATPAPTGSRALSPAWPGRTGVFSSPAPGRNFGSGGAVSRSISSGGAGRVSGPSSGGRPR